MLATSFFVVTLTTTNFSVASISSLSRQVKLQSTVSFATARWTEKQQQQQQRHVSDLSLHHMASSTTLYEILGIRVTASDEEIKAAYRRLARVYHPDVAPAERKESFTGEFMKIHTAYRTLSDPEKRANYDRSLIRCHQKPLTMSSSSLWGFSGYTSHNWETDQCW